MCWILLATLLAGAEEVAPCIEIIEFVFVYYLWFARQEYSAENN